LRIRGTVRVGQYVSSFGEAIRQFKYHGAEGLLPILGTLLVAEIRKTPWFDGIDAVVPVPTHWRHRLRRPLYAAERLADFVAVRSDVPIATLLRRTRPGPHQIGLSFTQRQANVKGAFALARGVRIEKARVLLIDDVRTTGATLEECAAILLRGGCAEVYAAVAATAGSATPMGHPITGI